jgi:hypothetical protein
MVYLQMQSALQSAQGGRYIDMLSCPQYILPPVSLNYLFRSCNRIINHFLSFYNQRPLRFAYWFYGLCHSRIKHLKRTPLFVKKCIGERQKANFYGHHLGKMIGHHWAKKFMRQRVKRFFFMVGKTKTAGLFFSFLPFYQGHQVVFYHFTRGGCFLVFLPGFLSQTPRSRKFKNLSLAQNSIKFEGLQLAAWFASRSGLSSHSLPLTVYPLTFLFLS